jgi:hypothetical protein
MWTPSLQSAVKPCETGHVHPRAAQLERIAEVLKLGKRKALALLHPQ